MEFFGSFRNIFGRVFHAFWSVVVASESVRKQRSAFSCDHSASRVVLGTFRVPSGSLARAHGRTSVVLDAYWCVIELSWAVLTPAGGAFSAGLEQSWRFLVLRLEPLFNCLGHLQVSAGLFANSWSLSGQLLMLPRIRETVALHQSTLRTGKE